MRKRIIQPERIKRVVVRGANWVGDAVMTVPALRELRRVLPGARITLATRSWAEGIFAGADFLDELVLIDGAARGLRSCWRQATEWRARRFDLAVLFPNAFETALVAFAARVPRRIGYATDGRGVLLSNPLPVPEWRAQRHEVFYYLNIIAELERLLRGSSDIETREPRTGLHIADERRRAAREMLRARGVGLNRPLVVLCPGSTNSRAKRWPAERFAALADRLVEEAGADAVLIGAPEESEVSWSVASLMRHKPIVVTGETTLAQTAALLGVADLLVTNDTGPAHVAAAVGCPVVVIFGPTNPLTTRPYSTLAEVVREPPECAPCMLRECPIDHRCMTAITAADVFARAVAVLERRLKLEAVR
ncbi:MAG: lipopolysaccharide heptosyltransferase II [Acidobacteria bacterium]|nr:lipopolysaccharide heptosyltransferase II [Acidobacteriota bacterium]